MIRGKTMYKQLLIITIMLFLVKGMAAAGDTLVINNKDIKYEVSEYLRYFTDSSSTVSIDQVVKNELSFKYQEINQPTVNLGISKYTHWFVFNVVNESPIEEWIFEIEYPTLNDVIFYVLNPEDKLYTIIKTGKDRFKKNNQAYTYSIHFDQKLTQGKPYKIFFRVKTESFIILPMHIMSVSSFIEKDRQKFSYLYLLYGIILALVAFNFILFILTRELNYLLLTVYLAILSMNAYYLYGYGIDFFPDIGPFLKSRMRQILFGFGALTFLLFTINYLELRKYKNLFRVQKVLVFLCLIYIPLLLIGSIGQSKFSKYTPFAFLIGAVINFIAGVYVYRKGERMALYYIISFSMFTLSSAIYFMTLFDIIPFNFITFNINSIATLLFGMLLTVGLVEKITAIRQEKAKTQNLEYMNKLLTNEIEERAKIEKELRESEERFRLLFELSPQPISLSEKETGLIIDANHQMETLSGFTKEEVIGNTSLNIKIIGEDDRNKILQQLGKTPQALGVEIDLYSKDGKKIHCLIYSHLVTIHGKNILISVFSDISEIKKNQESLKLSEKQLRELNSTKDKFFGIIAHDLMNPFNAMIGFTGLLIDAIKSGNYDEGLNYAHFIDYSSRRIFDLLQNLLIWSRTQSGKIAFTPSNVHVVELVTNSIDVLKSVAYSKNIEIVIDIEKSDIIFVDPNMIETVIRNLVSNAIKFSENGSKVYISLQKHESFFQICIKDSGIGIEAQQLNELFVLDKTISAKGTEGEMGIGLGLVLCQDFVIAHGGEIWAESEPGKGSRFCFTIPVNSESNAE
jgi:PAS domain S-box-containing protein